MFWRLDGLLQWNKRGNWNGQVGGISLAIVLLCQACVMDLLSIHTGVSPASCIAVGKLVRIV